MRTATLVEPRVTPAASLKRLTMLLVAGPKAAVPKRRGTNEMTRWATLRAVFLGVALIGGHPVTVVTAEPRISVMYNAPLITIEASGVTVAQVLREIGRKVGFSIVDAWSSDARLSFSIHDASLPGALQQLLRSENHVLLYRKGTQTIDTVMLLGARVAKAPVAFRPDHAFSLSEGRDQGWRNPSAEIAPTPSTPVSGAPPKTHSGDLLASDLEGRDGC